MDTGLMTTRNRIERQPKTAGCGALIFLAFAGILSAQAPTGFYCPDTGAANTITCSTYVALPALKTGMSFDVLLKNSVTGAATLVVDGLSGVPVTFNGTNPMVSGIMFAGGSYRLQFDGTEAVLQGPIPGCNTGCATGTVSPLQSVTLTIANAQVKTLHTVGTTLVAAAGSGTLLVPVSLTVENVFLTAAYTGGGSISVNYASPSGLQIGGSITAAFLTGPIANEMVTVALQSNQQGLSTVTLNQPLVLTCVGSDFAVGAGSLIVHLTYLVHTGFL